MSIFLLHITSSRGQDTLFKYSQYFFTFCPFHYCLLTIHHSLFTIHHLNIESDEFDKCDKSDEFICCFGVVLFSACISV
jgi:hypothetical protein